MRGLVLVASCLAGCSWIGVTPKPKPIPGSHAKYCTDSYFLPVVDTVYAAGAAAAETVGIVAVTTHDNTSSSFFDLRVPALLGVAVIVVTYTASAVHGYRAVHACND